MFIRSVVISAVAGLAAADMCQDFCIQQLGAAGCSKGSWCKNNHDCHALFYTGADRTSICVFTGVGSCRNTYPVLCGDATARLAPPVVTRAPVAAPTTPLRATVAPPVIPTRAVATVAATTASTAAPTATIRPEPTRAAATATIQATTPAPIQTTMAATTGPAVSQVPSTYLTLHYNPVVYDPRPRINVEFLGSAAEIGYSLMFDTGSDVSHIFQANATAAELADQPDSYWPLDDIDHSGDTIRPAKWLEGYHFVGDLEVTDVARTLRYGVDGAIRPIQTAMQLREMANLFSGSTSFIHEIEIDLTTEVDNRATGIGLFGAGRTSHFAEAVRTFAYVGPAAAYTGMPTEQGGTLVIGERNVRALQHFCLDSDRGFSFAPNKPFVSSIHWTIGGAVGLTGGAMTNVDWIIDTGAEGVFVTEEVYGQVVSGITSSGAVVEPITPRTYPRIFNCPANWEEAFPTITLRLGSLDVTMTPADYVSGPQGPMNICLLRLGTAGVSGRANVRLIGIRTLTKLATIFDRENDRVGFCIARM